MVQSGNPDAQLFKTHPKSRAAGKTKTNRNQNIKSPFHPRRDLGEKKSRSTHHPLLQKSPAVCMVHRGAEKPRRACLPADTAKHGLSSGPERN